LATILESLEYSKLKFEEYESYPDAGYKQKRIEEIAQVIKKIKSLKNKGKARM
jgi:hypothetical protein